MFLGLDRAPEFVFPLAFKPARIAVIGAPFRMRKNMREFDAADVLALAEWNPDALVAPIAQVLSLADLKMSGRAESLAFSTAIVALTRVGEKITEEDRDRLWNTFGIPVFEQRRAPNGHVVARECEVHDGLHITDAVLEILAGGEEVVTDECECGSSTPRLRRSKTELDEASAAD